jgi:hypothetical protein
MEQVEVLWAQKRQSKADRQTVYEWLDYNNKLTKQNTNTHFLVLYNATGTNLAAVALNRELLAGQFIVESKLYWCNCDTEAEANYLATVLNTELINRQIKPFQTKGLLGERDIHKKPLELPIPQFDPANKEHQRLAKLGEEASKLAIAVTKQGDFPQTLARQRAMVRALVQPQLTEIDRLVSKLMR